MITGQYHRTFTKACYTHSTRKKNRIGKALGSHKIEPRQFPDEARSPELLSLEFKASTNAVTAWVKRKDVGI